MTIRKERFFVVMFIGILFFQASYLINNYIYYTNSYYGFESFQFLSGFSFFQVFVILLSLTLTPIILNKPSDYFKFFYTLFAIFPNCFSTFIYKRFEIHHQLIYFLILTLPILLIMLLEKFKFKLNIKVINFEEDSLNWYLVFPTIIFCLYILIRFFDIGSFDIIDYYSRRLEGRNIFLPRNPISYMVGLIFNVICPFFSFLGGIKKEKIWIIISLMIGILGFWSLGLKAPIFFSLLFFYIGHTFNSKYNSPKYILIIVNTLCLIGIIEANLSSTLIIGEFFVRRIFLVIPLVQSYFYETFMNFNLSEIISGNSFKNFNDVTYYIGTKYFSNYQTNANTTSTLYFLLKNGIIGYIANLIFIPVLFIFLNSQYERKKNKITLFSGIIFSLLIIEASFTTILFSSGLLWFIIISYYSSRST
jgi:hypothetical protein